MCNFQAFTSNEIVADVISNPPEQALNVKFTKTEKTVNLGNEIAPVDVKEQPKVTYKANPNDFYTLIMTDPDAPSRANPVRREFRHWLVSLFYLFQINTLINQFQVVNIPGSDIEKGEVLSEYVGSGPPKDSGLHRYVFLLYRQPKKLEFEETLVKKTEVGDRPLFSARKFAEKYNMKLEAGNFYQAQYDDSVPALHQQLGLGKPAKTN